MLSDAELAAIEARVVEFQAARAAVTGERTSRDRYHAARAALDLHREDDLLALVAEVRRLRGLARACRLHERGMSLYVNGDWDDMEARAWLAAYEDLRECDAD